MRARTTMCIHAEIVILFLWILPASARRDTTISRPVASRYDNSTWERSALVRAGFAPSTCERSSIEASRLCHRLATTLGIERLSTGACGTAGSPNYARGLQGVDDQYVFHTPREVSTPAASTMISRS